MDKRSVKCLLKRYTDINKQVKRYSTPYTTVEFQIKIMRYQYTPIRIVTIQNAYSTNGSADVGQREQKCKMV